MIMRRRKIVGSALFLLAFVGIMTSGKSVKNTSTEKEVSEKVDQFEMELKIKDGSKVLICIKTPFKLNATKVQIKDSKVIPYKSLLRSKGNGPPCATEVLYG